LLLFTAALATGTAQQDMRRGPVRSPHGPLNIACGNCHTSVGWQPLRAVPEFDHSRETTYPLKGMHAKVECVQCHTNSIFREASTRCADCHADIHRRQLGARCEDCHSVKGWNVKTQAVREHSARFPLVGAHAAVDCEGCHKGAGAAQYIGLSTACASCHIKEFSNTKTINHVAAKFPVLCDQCHNSDNWLSVRFDHARFGGFVLSGVHAALDCVSCHAGNRFAGTPASCYGCHAKEFAATTNPNHPSAGFPTDCSLCHNSSTWLTATFNHSTSGFPLTGAHAATPCAQCHVNNQFANTATQCAGCHLKVYQTATNPNHATSGFPTTCEVCHTTTAWSPATFNHAASKFPLTGAHVNTPCAQCHVNNDFVNTSTQCASCHLATFNKTTNPNHVAAGFPTDCSVCHSTTDWLNAVFNHNNTKFPLVGAHKPLACSACHSNGQFATLATTCVSCHLKDFQGANNPPHAASGFPQTCEVCHTATAWSPASFNHGTTKFPLTGAHVNTPCTSCHINNVFAGTPTDCYSCHKTEYQTTNNPNHAASGFPTSCADCHTTTTWTGATFTHSKFPIYSGNHARVWTTCGDCHTNPANYQSFTCINCHTHNQTSTDAQHRGVRNYAYAPTTCYSCHPTGRGD
jgi:hypothetical protein